MVGTMEMALVLDYLQDSRARDAGAQVHNVPVAGSPIQGLPQEEGVTRHAGEGENPKQEKKDSETKGGSNEEDSYSYKYESEESEEEEKEEDNDEPEEKDPLTSKTLEEFYRGFSLSSIISLEAGTLCRKCSGWRLFGRGLRSRSSVSRSRTTQGT